jgi:5'-deoxynucleotidase YfbR-like HD superfamily hydrolase
MTILTFLEDRRAGFITRWHARQVQRKESLAEHHYFVLHDSLVILDALRHHKILEKLGLEEPDELKILLMAHFHDAPEFESGDVSGAAKRDFPDLARAVRKVERKIADSLIFRDLPDDIAERYRGYVRQMVHQEYRTLEQQIVKYADKLEALLYAKTEVDIGNTLMVPVVEQVRGELQVLTWAWLVELRKETGLP